MNNLVFHAAGVAIILALAFVLYPHGQLALILLAPAVVIIWIFVPKWRDDIAAALHEGRPGFLFRSRRDPPWMTPRALSEHGDRRERADLRALRARLTRVAAGPPADPSDYLAPETYRDEATGQYWREEKFEHGFNQWSVFVPIAPPG